MIENSLRGSRKASRGNLTSVVSPFHVLPISLQWSFTFLLPHGEETCVDRHLLPSWSWPGLWLVFTTAWQLWRALTQWIGFPSDLCCLCWCLKEAALLTSDLWLRLWLGLWVPFFLAQHSFYSMKGATRNKLKHGEVFTIWEHDLKALKCCFSSPHCFTLSPPKFPTLFSPSVWHFVCSQIG